ncbi:hypothetical protein BD626DRAFT_478145 [Schizophyllum amplum]|uniref:Uncharacterized protein n=1 Tax=Schizophyllum amplum TaxID=97359 RepID=A0A550D0S7_9AGAR|nr:hypothetical protein BD626DRAFT_478145 [Auriculariopsis ampla]
MRRSRREGATDQSTRTAVKVQLSRTAVKDQPTRAPPMARRHRVVKDQLSRRAVTDQSNHAAVTRHKAPTRTAATSWPQTQAANVRSRAVDRRSPVVHQPRRTTIFLDHRQRRTVHRRSRTVHRQRRAAHQPSSSHPLHPTATAQTADNPDKRYERGDSEGPIQVACEPQR